MAANRYEQLRELMDLNPMGCPPAPEIIDILKILFTEEEAKIALGLGFLPLLPQEVSFRTGVPREVAERHLEALANKGVVFAREKDGNWGYALVNTFHLFENPFRKGEKSGIVEKLTPLWKKYAKTLMKGFGSETTAVSRIIPIHKKLESKAEILPHERVLESIDNAKAVGIGHCACRELEQKCDAPREACMMFDATCTYLADRGFARYISKGEAKEKIIQFDEAGLVRQVNNTKDRLEYVCHCCPCCCTFLRAINEYENPRVFTRSAFLPSRDLSKCAGCGTCADRLCPTKAIAMSAKFPEVNTGRCIGCGVCAAGCPNDAIRMERQLTIPDPPANILEYGMRLLQEQGKLEAFMEVSTPKAK
jgi:formate hydrogenlyase subunit 6/NADH:ubiquinone oxidoreductase subunit I/DNA-binding transcriptional ArsR family regulator